MSQAAMNMAAINVGHPDVGTALGRYATAVGEMQGAMNDLATIRCVVWVNINTWSLKAFVAEHTGKLQSPL